MVFWCIHAHFNEFVHRSVPEHSCGVDCNSRHISGVHQRTVVLGELPTEHWRHAERNIMSLDDISLPHLLAQQPSLHPQDSWTWLVKKPPKQDQWYLSYPVWLISLSTKFSRLIRDVSSNSLCLFQYWIIYHLPIYRSSISSIHHLYHLYINHLHISLKYLWIYVLIPIFLINPPSSFIYHLLSLIHLSTISVSIISLCHLYIYLMTLCLRVYLSLTYLLTHRDAQTHTTFSLPALFTDRHRLLKFVLSAMRVPQARHSLTRLLCPVSSVFSGRVASWRRSSLAFCAVYYSPCKNSHAHLSLQHWCANVTNSFNSKPHQRLPLLICISSWLYLWAVCTVL